MNWKKLINNSRLRQSKRGADARNDFESDFGRIIFSSAMRRMHDKTQVFPLTTDDNIHSRLTHSMEVMAIGHSLGIRICEKDDFASAVGSDKINLFREIPVLLKNACLVHDIGNPPFGHFGETVIKEYFKKTFAKEKEKEEKAESENKKVKTLKLTPEQQEDFTNFDGNAQGFRVLTKLQILNDVFGLNLTFGTLASYTKYPNYGKIDKSKIGKKKRGVFQSEIKYLEQISEACGLKKDNDIIRHPLCFLMEAADSICYLVMDMEDGFNKGWYSFSEIGKHFESDVEIQDKIEKLEKEHIGNGQEITKMVNLRIYLIDRLVKIAEQNFLKNLSVILEGEYNQELIKDDEKGLEKLLTNFCVTKIFPNREITSLELTGHSVLTGLLDYYLEFIFHENKDYRNRAQGLISDGILRAVFFENKDIIFSKRLQEFKDKSQEENKDKHKYELQYTELKELLDTLEQLKSHSTNTENKEEKLRNTEVEIFGIVKPHIDDLDNYYKLRVIVDFISGMTDQFALNHYQKLSGQKIN